MPIFTAIATAALAGTALAGTFAVTAVATGLSVATSIGLSYAVKALSGKQDTQHETFGVQGKLSGGGDVPRSFGLGYHTTAGSLVYANTHGGSTQTPNAFLTQVIALSDLPGERLVGLWVNGAKVTLSAGDADYTNFSSSGIGYQVPEYIKLLDGESSPTAHLFVKFYNGTQTTADAYTVANCNSTERPYTSAHVGKGICYAVVHAYVNEDMWNGFPTLKFELSGVPLYDPSKDSTVGGSGSQLYSDPSTWGGDGDNFPAVQIYNILRGFSYGGTWLYGLQNTSAARLPVANWIAQIDKCRSTVIESTGSQPTYRTGGQINVDAQPANAIEAILTGCQGRVSEIGGFYKIHLGTPDSPTFTFSDDDILSTESQTYRPFFSLADSVNGIQATYPDPAQGWNTATAPPYYRTDLEARDGNRRLMASPAFDFVPYPEQAQRLQKSAIEEAQRARTHALVLPPAFWIVEPGDVGEWTSARNGYSSKQFRVDSVVDRANLDVSLALTEVDPADYDWNTGTDFTSVTGGGTISNPPAPQAIDSFDAQPYTLVDADGIGRRPAILISWNVQPGIAAVQYEVRLAVDGSIVTRGRTDRPIAGNLIITQSILPDAAYQVRGRFMPTTPRDMLWSDWLDVTTPDVRFSLAEFDAALKAQVTVIRDQFQDQITEALNRIASIASSAAMARSWLDKREVRSQLSSRSDAAFAEITNVQTVLTAADAALASDIETLTAQLGDAEANIEINATALATLNSSFSSYQTTVTAQFATTNSNVTANATAIATLDGYAAAQYGVTLNVNGYATGFNLVNGGGGISSFTVVSDKFQIQLPGYNGEAPVSVFTTGTIGGVPSIGLSGNVFLDGTLNASKIVAGSIDTTRLAVNSVDINQLIDGAANNVGAANGTGSASVSVNIQAGRAVVIASVQPAVDNGQATYLATLTVDGSTIVTGSSTAPMTFYEAPTGTITWGQASPVVLARLVTGLSAGSHTFAMSVTRNGSSYNVPCTVIVINPRR